MSKESDNKAIIGRWFTDFWGEKCNLGIVDELAAPNMLLQYSLHEPRRGRDDIKAFMAGFRAAFPDLKFLGCRGADRRRRLRRRSLGGRRNAHGSRLQRLPDRSAPGSHRPQD